MMIPHQNVFTEIAYIESLRLYVISFARHAPNRNPKDISMDKAKRRRLIKCMTFPPIVTLRTRRSRMQAVENDL